MSTFDNYADTPYQIRTEGQEITLKFERTGPTTARISWNIPIPASGCASDVQAYNGIVITLDNTPTTVQKSPVNGIYYTSDPTADRDLHAGDKIDTALVIGAFYDDKTTTFFDISGLETNTPYYVSGYAVDVVARYHTEGVHAYSLDYGIENETPGKAGSQTVMLGSDGVALTDGTGLIPGDIYDFQINVNETDYQPTSINGTDAQTYSDLLNALNAEFAKLTNPYQGSTPPDAGSYYWDALNNKLFQWDGYVHNELDVIVEPTDPTIIASGDFWYEPDTDTLYRRDIPLAGWNIVTNIIKYHQDPTTLNCDDYWFNGSDAYNWDGTVWCQKTLAIQVTDPSLPILPVCGSYWFNETDSILYKWNEETSNWDADEAIYWNVDPNSLVINTYWFDETNQVLNQWSGTIWNNVAATISETEPEFPVANQYWFDTANEELFQRDAGNTTWIQLDVLLWATDPTIRNTCDLWWDSASDNLYIWDVTTNAWDLVASFVQQETDPAAAPILVAGENLWYNPTTEILSEWDGVEWVEVTFIDYPTDPTIVASGDIWLNTATNEWTEWTGTWTAFNPTDSNVDPDGVVLPTGSYWYDTTTNQAKQWNGTTWVNLMFTTVPLTPANGTLWFNTNTNTLMEWNGTQWLAGLSVVTVALNSEGHLIFTSSSTGAGSCVIITDGTLFISLTPTASIQDPVLGTDGIDAGPMYAQQGVGTDGSSDERRELMDSIRAQLGYPVVAVELTKYQLDLAVTAGIESLRKKSDAGYKRAFFFIDLLPSKQNYLLTNKIVGFNKIVSISAITRTTSAFLTTAYGSGVYGQVILQHLYNMGTFDLVSYHMISEYIEQLEHLFASRIVFQWDEHTRRLDILQSIATKERVLVDAVIERTEQELLTDRFTKTWIEKYALSEARIMLAEIRGKYASLPGAGGGVSLNAAELITRAETDKAELLEQLDNFVVGKPEEWGMQSQFTIG